MPDRLVGGRYRLVGPLGRGGMAVVWRGRDELLGREVAVKTLDLTGPDSDGWAARFEREARATAALNNPNIVTVFDTGVEGHTAYLVMELLPGPTLAERVKESGPLSILDARSVALQMCAALSAAHAAGIVHRDIKPANVSYAADGTVKVLDFGITQLMDDPGHALTSTNTVMGTADYLAPEQALGGRVDTRADLYALGCVIYTLLTGEPPFHSETAVATMMRHASEPAPEVRALRPDTPDDMAALVGQLLTKDPAARPASADAVAAVLRGDANPTPGAATTQVLPPVVPPVLDPTQPETVLPPAPMDLRPMPVRPRRGVGTWLPWLLLLLLVGAVLLYVFTQLDRGTPRPGTTTASTTSSSTSASSTTKRPTTSRTTSTPSSTTTTPTTSSTTSTTTTDARAAVTALRDAVVQSAASGDIKPEAAQKLGEQLDQIQKALGNNGGKAPEEVAKFGELVQELTADDEITQAGATALSGPYAALVAAVGG